MAETSGISWTDATFNPVIGCTKVSEACRNCYAERDFDHRRHVAIWGPSGTRVLTSHQYWMQPIVWNKQSSHDMVTVDNITVALKRGVETTRQSFLAGASKAVEQSLNRCIAKGYVKESDGLLLPGRKYHRPRVFCASLADVFEDWKGPIVDSKGKKLFHNRYSDAWTSADELHFEADIERPVTMNDVRRRLFDLIDATPNLDWLVLTKRPENIRRMWTPKAHYAEQYPDDPYPNADAVTTTAGPAFYRSNVWIGTSIENQHWANKRVPELLRCRDLSPVLFLSGEPLLGHVDLEEAHRTSEKLANFPNPTRVDWVIAGGESGQNARPSHPDWFRSLRDQCDKKGVAFHFKQWGEFAPVGQVGGADEMNKTVMFLGGDPGSPETGSVSMLRAGVKLAGRTLDGVVHDSFPEVNRDL